MSKILQLIPAPAGAYMEHSNGDKHPVICLAHIGPRRKSRIVPVVAIAHGKTTLIGLDEIGALRIEINFGELSQS